MVKTYVSIRDRKDRTDKGRAGFHHKPFNREMTLKTATIDVGPTSSSAGGERWQT